MSNKNVVAYKLTNGVEIIGTVVSEDDKTINLADAFFLQAYQGEGGSIKLDYAPLTTLGRPANKTHHGFDVAMPRASVLFPFEPHPGITDQYLKIVDDVGLILPPEKGIIT